ncbi:MAG: hypothetical protein GF398_19615 [Chitinivibrionales bacterium]|nr:hypothetical protein [Chitinivibrionales bacterium]
MLIHLQQLPEGYSERTSQLPIDSRLLEQGVFKKDVACRARIDRIQQQIHIRLTYQAEIEFECSRCLNFFSHCISDSFYLIVKQRQSLASQEENDDDFVELYYEADAEEIDISDAVRDEIITSLPMKPLCDESCAGIDSTRFAQKNRNSGEDVDPRWDALWKLRNRSEDTNSR